MFGIEVVDPVWPLLNRKLVCEFSGCTSEITGIGMVGRGESRGRVLA